MKRKIIQISESLTDNKGWSLSALCDDGTVWTWYQGSWERFQDIPQDAVAETVSDDEKRKRALKLFSANEIMHDGSSLPPGLYKQIIDKIVENWK